eukprot:scaffold4919_cov258-Ochromonas_danica.AAC.1
MTPKVRNSVVRSHMFLKEKRNGILKSRLVVDGRMQNKDEAGDISSPTSSVDALFMVAAIAAKEKRHVMTMDIEGVFLHAPMTNDIVMELDPMLSDIMISLDNAQSSSTSMTCTNKDILDDTEAKLK